MKPCYHIKKARKWYKVYNSLTNATYISGLTYYQAKKIATKLNEY